jgi:hypothetical protein
MLAPFRFEVARAFRLVIFALTTLASTNAPAQESNARQKQLHSQPPVDAVDQEQFVAYWTLEGGWGSELQLRNNMVAADLIITPALRSPDGAETALSPVTVHPQEIKIIDLESAVLATAPRYLGTYGSVVLRYHSPANRNLFAMLMIHDRGHSIAFHIDATGEDENTAPAGREGIWWLPNETATDQLVVTNQSAHPVQADLSFYDSAGREAKQTLTLQPRGTARLSARELIRANGLSGAFGGLRIFAPSHGGSLDSVHLLYDETASFSAFLKMFDHGANTTLEERDFAHTKTWTLRAPMLALSQPDPALAFPEGTTLQPQLFVRNTMGKTVDISLRFNWRGVSAIGKTAGPSLRLGPFETQRIDVAALQASNSLPKDAAWTSVTLTTNSRPEEVVALAVSYDKTLRYGAQTPFSDQLAFEWVGSLWEYDVQHNSLITAGNGGTKPVRAGFTIYYNGGTQKYELEQALQPDEQMWIDVGKLIREQVPDKNGKLLPQDLTSGSYALRDLSDKFIGSLYEGKVVYDKTFGHVTYGCAGCCAYSTTQLHFSPLGIPLLSTADNGVDAYDTCSSWWEPVDESFYGNWTTGSTAIATVSYYGTHTGQAVGATTSYTSGYLLHPTPRTCSNVLRSPQGSDNVVSATITVHFTGSKTVGTPGDGLTFPSNSTCSQNLGLFNCTGPGAWVWNVEIQANVSDDASKWTTRQSYTGRSKGNWKDSSGVLHAFDDPLNVPNDNPLSGFVQQTSGTTVIFWIDAPGHYYNYGTSGPIDSLTQVQNFTSTVCSTVNPNICSSKAWYLKLVVKPGAVLDATNSAAAFGTASTNF